MSISVSDETPMDTLRRIGIAPSGWATSPGFVWEENDLLTWEITVNWLNSASLRDIAFLITEGWTVAIHGRSSRVRIRINREATS